MSQVIVVDPTNDVIEVVGAGGPPGPVGPIGPAGPQGPPGSSAGRVFYLATSNPSDIPGYGTMLESPSPNPEQAIATTCSGSGDTLIQAFATDPGVPGPVAYGAGTAYRRFYAKVSTGTAQLHYQVFIRSQEGVETIVRDELGPQFSNTTVQLIEWIATAPNAGMLLSTDRIVNKLYARRIAGPATITVTSYYEGQAGSHIQSTISGGSGLFQSGTGPPTIGVGTEGTIYLDTATGRMWGPKTGGAWPAQPLGRIIPLQPTYTQLTSG
jgi:hypothetical protein